MGLVARALTKNFANPYGASAAGFPAFNPHVDRFRKGTAPNALEMINECLNAAYACVCLNSQLVASTPLRLYVRTGKGEPSRLRGWKQTAPITRKIYDRLRKNPNIANDVSEAADIEEVIRNPKTGEIHPVLELLNNPNGIDGQNNSIGLNRNSMIETVQRFLEVVGRAYWYLEENSLGTPSQLWVLASHLVQEIPDFQEQNIISRYLFGAGVSRRAYEPEEIIPFRMVDLHTVYLGGFSPMRAAFEKIKLLRSFDAHTNALLDNAGMPSALFTPSGEYNTIGEVEAERLRSKFRQMFAMAGRGGVLVAQWPGQLTPLNWPSRDIVDLEFSNAAKIIICNCFGVPVTKLERNDATRANAESGDYAHGKDAGIPRCRAMEAVLNRFLLPRFDDTGRLFFCFDSPVADDRNEYREDVKAMPHAVTRNEYRDFIGLDPVPWGDLPLAPNNVVPVDPTTGVPEDRTPEPVAIGGENNPAEEKPKAKSVVVGNIGPDGKAGPLPQGANIAAILQRIFLAQGQAVLAALENKSVEDVEGDYLARCNGHGPKIKEATALHAWKRAMRKDRNETLDNLTPEGIPKTFIDLSAWDAEIARQVMPVIELTAANAGQRLLTRIGASPDVFSVVERNIPKAAQEMTLKLSRAINQTTEDRLDQVISDIRDEISSGLMQGDTRPELRQRIQRVFHEASQERAETIARTESSRATHMGEKISAKESGVVKKKTWIASADCCPI